MPSRWLRFLIVLFWLTTTGWLFWHDLWPKWRPGEPPPFHIDDVEEVQHNDQAPMSNNWIVERQKEGQIKPHAVFYATTWVKHNDDDDYTLHAKLDATKDAKYQPVFVAKIFRIDQITSAYRVNRDGQLRALEATVNIHFNPELSFLGHLFPAQPFPIQKDASDDPLSLNIWGEVHERHFFAHCRANMGPLDKPVQFDLPATEVSHTGSVVMPLHPVSRIRGLRLGQSWRQPLVDPLRDAFASLPGSGMRWLQACVLPRPQMLEVDDSKTSCLVIEYTNDENDVMGRTWVEQDGERVLQQEAILEDGRWIMKREPTRRSHFRTLDR